MNWKTTQNLLEDINEGLILGKRITKTVIESYLAVLISVPDEFYSKVKMEIMKTWKYRSIPTPAHMKEICDSLGHHQEHNDKPCELNRRKEEERLYETRKFRHKDAVTEFVKRITEGYELTEQQQKAYDLIMKYMHYTFGTQRDPKDELKEREHPYAWSFTGLYMDYLENKLPYLTGETKGNLREKQPYDPHKERIRKRSLGQEKQRSGDY